MIFSKSKGYLFKKVSSHVDRKDYPKNKLKKKVCKELIAILSQNYNIIFVDEVGTKLNPSLTNG